MTQAYTRPRTRINIGVKNLRNLTREFTAALVEYNNPPRLFKQGGTIVSLYFDGDGNYYIRPLNVDSMTHKISEAIDCFTVGRDDIQIPQFPPPQVVKNVLADPNLAVPTLNAVVRTPVYTPKGRLVAVPGYDAESGIYYYPKPGSNLEGITTRIDTKRLQEAVDTFRELTSDFPFKATSDFAHSLAIALLPFVRPMIRGQVPMFATTKTLPAEGATLLNDSLVFPALGAHVPRTPAPSDESEWTRTLHAVLAGLPQVVLLDNIVGGLRSAALASAITAPSITCRRIRSSEASTVPVGCVLLATGINITTSAELARRTILINLDSGDAHPELRTGFKIPNLEVWVREHHADLLVALLTIIQAWIDEGCPRSTKVLGGFEEFAAIMGGILDVAGVPGFLDGVVRPPVVGEVNEAAWADFVVEWGGTHYTDPVTSKTLCPLARKVGLLPPSGTVTQLGTIISGHLGEVVEGLVIKRATKLHGDNRWVLEAE